MIIAIDGPAASGKGTLGKRLADRLCLPYLDTGLLYRAVAFKLIGSGRGLDDGSSAVEAAAAIDLDDLNSPALRAKEMGEAASVVSALPELRAALLGLQRGFADRPGGAILDGRDIGTVICPSADVKIFVTANPETRAARRVADLAGRGEQVRFSEVLAEIVKRDRRDSSRPDAPLSVAVDALVIDSTSLDAEGVMAQALEFVLSAAPGEPTMA
jgi:cytidylate kinase